MGTDCGGGKFVGDCGKRDKATTFVKRAHSSDGRALALQARGREFNSP